MVRVFWPNTLYFIINFYNPKSLELQVGSQQTYPDELT
ncbi:hypothetical protein YE105_C0121 [Yersinia enterocolitica subsp. palearctica 105.5R(r)]|uniref:Uncharacterized protein n=1 Tax=Yersinia enterocolitica subsp. palearctica serotype O:3 (strain DSM 13030 / CIP 106945 / Y11) TaxID=930944 RepID=A0A0H3NX16_YERE1|nr:hypothetical protein YE105_C0121 [Yersinia enterocolitica subsp. palearctica 105.5R(r)]CBY25374.1 hypothetical protein Y11_28071 [Yersinia enterocolitica subsp. palearctica Y11]CCO70802.1 hypothetical protein D322_3956 [Yersinia enterocolitica IP 10393]